MPIYHLSVKAVSRSTGRSATAAAAYRAGCSITDERTGEVHDYTRKRGVESADVVLPIGAPQWANDRAKLWNAAEMAEKRKDACVAREYEVALPSELSPYERRRLVMDFAKEMANEEGCAVDVAIHAPRIISDSDLENDPGQHFEIDLDGQRHNGNHHAHMLRSTRKLEPDGMGAKLETEKAGRKRSDDLEAVRARWAEFANARLRQNGIAARVDHRSLEMQGIDREPTTHLGVEATGYERRTGLHSEKRMQQAQERLTRAKELGELERQIRQCDQLIFDWSNDLTAAKAERDRQKSPAPAREIEPPTAAPGLTAAFAANYQKWRRKAEAEPVPPVPVRMVDWFDLTSYGLSVSKSRMGKNDRELLVTGSLDAHETQLIGLGFRRVGDTFRAELTDDILRMPRWRKAFPSIAIAKVHANDTFTDEPKKAEAEPRQQGLTDQLSNGKPMNAQTPTTDYELAENIRQRREVNPGAQPSLEELRAIDRILVQQARERLEGALTDLELAAARPEPEPDDESHSNRPG